MREIHCNEIINVIEKLCQDSNYYLNEDILMALKSSVIKENNILSKMVLNQLIENAHVAKNEKMPMCQDTGMVVVFIEIGQDVHVVGGNISDAINEGVRRGYKNGHLRNSVLNDPILRVNTNDNTPAVIHYEIVFGESIKICVVPKGFGSENMSAIKMLNPSDGIDGIKNFIIDTVNQKGANACPPMIIGVGIGGTMEKAAILSKKAIIRPITVKSNIPHIRKLEDELFLSINNLEIGPAGYGGDTTVLSVNIEVFPTHIAGLPVAVNISCNATRHAEYTI